MTAHRSTSLVRVLGVVAAGALITAGAVVPASAASNPPAPRDVKAVPSSGAVTLTWTSGKGSTKGFNVYRSTSSSVRLSNPLNGRRLITARSYRSAGLVDGRTYWFVVQSVGGSSSLHAQAATVHAVPRAVTTKTPKLSISNPDAVPGSDRFVMSRMEYYATPDSLFNDLDPDASLDGTPTWYRVHDVATVHVTNVGAATAHLDALTISDPSSFSTPTAAPLTIAPGASVDIPVRFVYTGGSVYGAVIRTATLTIATAGIPSTVVQLAGEWQPGPAREAGAEPPTLPYFEPFLSQVVNGLFGWRTDIGATGYLNNDSAKYPFGDEHVSSFWQAANPAEPVTVTRIGAWTGAGLGAFNWYPSSDASGCATQTEASCNAVLPAFKPAAATTDDPTADPSTINPADAEIDESVFPVQVGDTLTHAFTPGSTPFGLQIAGQFSDDSRNSDTNDVTLHDCVTECGHHMRFFPVVDATGVTVPNTWIVTIDLGGLNNDFNDDIAVVTNLAPAS